MIRGLFTLRAGLVAFLYLYIPTPVRAEFLPVPPKDRRAADRFTVAPVDVKIFASESSDSWLSHPNRWTPAPGLSKSDAGFEGSLASDALPEFASAPPVMDPGFFHPEKEGADLPWFRDPVEFALSGRCSIWRPAGFTSLSYGTAFTAPKLHLMPDPASAVVAGVILLAILLAARWRSPA